MTLPHFEEYISKTILQRGRSYFLNGLVQPPEKWTDDRYEFLVSGTEAYQVRIDLDGDEIRNVSCTCPYDQELMCKHLAAALFYLREHWESLNTQVASTGETQIRELLQKLSKEDLQSFLLRRAERDSHFRNELLMTFSQSKTKDVTAHYRKHLRQLIQRAAGPGGYVDWYRAKDLSEGVGEMLAQAHSALESGNEEQAFSIACVVIDELLKALQFADDSGAYISERIGESIGILQDVISNDPVEESRQLIFSYCLAAFESGRFEDWDWHWDFLQLAAEVAKKEEEIAQIFTQTQKDYASKYDRETAQEIHYHFLIQLDQTEAAQSYLQSNRRNATLRRIVIRQHIANGNFK